MIIILGAVAHLTLILSIFLSYFVYIRNPLNNFMMILLSLFLSTKSQYNYKQCMVIQSEEKRNPGHTRT